MSSEISSSAVTDLAALTTLRQSEAAQQKTRVAAQSETTGTAEPVQVDSKLVAQAIEVLNQMAESQQRDLKFSVDQPSGRTVIRVFDSTSQELIRQIPGDAVLTLARQFGDGDLGALMDVVA